jgi:hypothetical protein
VPVGSKRAARRFGSEPPVGASHSNQARAMAELKTRPTNEDVRTFLDSVSDEDRRRDCLALLDLMREVTGEDPMMWGPSIIGFGSYHYTYASGREGDWPLTGFSPRKRDLTVYIMAGFERYESLMTRLGKHKVGKSCLYLKRLDDVDREILRELIAASVAHLRTVYEGTGQP